MGAAQGVQLEARVGWVESTLSLAVLWRTDATKVPKTMSWLRTFRPSANHAPPQTCGIWGWFASTPNFTTNQKSNPLGIAVLEVHSYALILSDQLSTFIGGPSGRKSTRPADLADDDLIDVPGAYSLPPAKRAELRQAGDWKAH